MQVNTRQPPPGGNAAEGLAVDNAGNLYAAMFALDTIEKFSPTGVDLGVFAARLGSPAGLVFDTSGNLWVSDFLASTGVIEKFTPNGIGSFLVTGWTVPSGWHSTPRATLSRSFSSNQRTTTSPAWTRASTSARVRAITSLRAERMA